MIHTICAVRDRAVDGFMQPIYVPHVGHAIRSFTDEINRADSPMNKHPEDYDLYQLGEYDDSNGLLQSVDVRMLVTGKQVYKPSSD